MLRSGIRIVAALLVIAPALASTADAQNRGREGGHAAPAARTAPAPRAVMRSAPAIRQAAPHAMSPRIATQHRAVPRSTINTVRRNTNINRAARTTQTRRSIASSPNIQQHVKRDVKRGKSNIARKRDNVGNTTPNVADKKPQGRGVTTRSARMSAPTIDRTTAIQRSVLRNQSFADRRRTGADARATFHGRYERFSDHDRRRHRHRGIVIGWAGPLFWPFAYDDFIDYTYSGYAYDTFWPYTYDDVYEGVFGPYAFVGSAYANAPAYSARGGASVRVPDSGVAQVCTEQASALTGGPIAQIEQAVEPTEAQRAALADLKGAAAKAVALLQAACPTDIPSTPVGRLAAMRKRIDAMVQAVAAVRPALERFYDSLSDEQKERYNALAPDDNERPAAGRQADLTKACSGQVTASLPFERIRQAIRPDDEQRAAFDALNQASSKAADLLKANCGAQDSLTPTGRIEAMEQRLNAMLKALDIVQPALERFYGSLNDEQKARFNQLGTRQG